MLRYETNNCSIHKQLLELVFKINSSFQDLFWKKDKQQSTTMKERMPYSDTMQLNVKHSTYNHKLILSLGFKLILIQHLWKLD